MADDEIHKRGNRFKDIAGQRFGRLVAVELAPFRKTPEGRRRTYWLCRCDCGVIKEIAASRLARRSVYSCGCFKYPNPSMRHGRTGTAEYRSWRAMIDRCTLRSHRSWDNYGGRGVMVCDEWLSSFESFFEHVGSRPSPSHTLDRIDNDGDYEPGNVRWSTASEQRKNQRSRPLKTQSRHGHEYTPENTYWKSDGSRSCRTCVLKRNAVWHQRNRKRRSQG